MTGADAIASTVADDHVTVRGRREIVDVDPFAQPDRDTSLERVRRGVYALAEDLKLASRRARYLCRIEAVSVTRDRPVFARESALAIHGLPFGVDPERVFTAGGASTAGVKAGVVHSPVELDALDVVAVGDLLVCSSAYALADVARRRDSLVAVAALDAALRTELVSVDDVFAALSRQGPRGRRRAEWSIAFADGAAESVGESYSRVRIHQLGYPAPELQPRVIGRSGREYRPDVRWSLGSGRPLLGEFDGAVKYGELAEQAGKTGAQALAEEKAREDDLRFAHDVARWVWDDLMRPARLDAVLAAHGLPRERPPIIALRRD